MEPRIQNFRLAHYLEAANARSALLTQRAPGMGETLALYFDMGWLDTEYWLPITNDAATMQDAFGVYHPAKTSQLYRPETFAALSQRAQDLVREPPYERAFALGASSNYWHYLMDFLPRLAWLFASGESGMPLLVNGSFGLAQRAILNRLYAYQHWPEPSVMALTEPIATIKRVVFPVRPTLASAVRFWDVHLPAGETTPPQRRLFLRRGHVSSRRLLNEDDVAAALTARGFEDVNTGAMSFDDQVALMREALLVVAPHGAALANLVFAPPGGALVELIAGYEQPFFSNLAAAKRWRRLVVRDESVPHDATHHSDFRIDVRSLCAALDGEI